MLLSIDINSYLGCLHCVDVGSVARISEVHVVSVIIDGPYKDCSFPFTMSPVPIGQDGIMPLPCVLSKHKPAYS